MLSLDACVAVGFAQAVECSLITEFSPAFEVHRMTDVSVVDGTHLCIQRLAYIQQDRRDQSHQSEWMLEHHQAPDLTVAE